MHSSMTPPKNLSTVTEPIKQASGLISAIAYTDPDHDNSPEQRVKIANQLQNIPSSANGPFSLLWGPVTRGGVMTFVAYQSAADGVYFVGCRGTISPDWNDFTDFIKDFLDDVEGLALHAWQYPPYHSSSKEGKEVPAYVTFGDNVAFTDMIEARDGVHNQTILQFLQTQMYESPRPVIVTGHSLGGALANLLSVYLAYSLGISDASKTQARQVVPVTLAAPTTSNDIFAELFQKYCPLTCQIINVNDIVPMAWANLSGMIWAYTPPPSSSSSKDEWMIKMPALYHYSKILWLLTSACYTTINMGNYNFTPVASSSYGVFTGVLVPNKDWSAQAFQQHSILHTYLPYLKVVEPLLALDLPSVPPVSISRVGAVAVAGGGNKGGVAVAAPTEAGLTFQSAKVKVKLSLVDIPTDE